VVNVYHAEAVSYVAARDVLTSIVLMTWHENV
jgi:hypothetical protein